MSVYRNVRVTEVVLYFLPVKLRVPLKFGHQVLSEVTCARVRVRVENGGGQSAEGWGETPLSVPWVWPSALDYGERHDRLKDLCRRIAVDLEAFTTGGHPMEIGHAFQRECLPVLHAEADAEYEEAMPHLAALVCLSAFDLAVFDAYGNLHEKPVFELLGSHWLNHDLAYFLEGEEGFSMKFPADYLVKAEMSQPVWHLVGGLDPVDEPELRGDEPDDGYPVLLREWIRRDGLKCLKVKLRGNDAKWDYDRILKIGMMGIEEGVDWLTTDFNCTVTDPDYVNAILDRLRDEAPRIHGMILYVDNGLSQIAMSGSTHRSDSDVDSFRTSVCPDTYPTRMTGLMYAVKDFEFFNKPDISGVVVANEKIKVNATSLNLSYINTYLNDPPPGFDIGTVEMKVVAGTWKRSIE